MQHSLGHNGWFLFSFFFHKKVLADVSEWTGLMLILSEVCDSFLHASSLFCEHFRDISDKTGYRGWSCSSSHISK